MTSILQVLGGHLLRNDAPLHHVVEWSNCKSETYKLRYKAFAEALDELRKRGWFYSDKSDGSIASPAPGWNHPIHGWARELETACKIELSL